MTDKQPWPGEYGDQYWYIYELSGKIKNLCEKIIIFGDESGFTHPFVGDAVRILGRAADKLSHAVIEVDRIMPMARYGRPYWVNTAIRKSTEISGRILETTYSADQALDDHKIATFEQLIINCRKDSDTIIRLFLEGPIPQKPTEPTTDSVMLRLDQILVDNWPTR